MLRSSEPWFCWGPAPCGWHLTFPCPTRVIPPNLVRPRLSAYSSATVELQHNCSFGGPSMIYYWVRVCGQVANLTGLQGHVQDQRQLTFSISADPILANVNFMPAWALLVVAASQKWFWHFLDSAFRPLKHLYPLSRVKWERSHAMPSLMALPWFVKVDLLCDKQTERLIRRMWWP